MKIVWAPNPLNTVIELDDADKVTLRLKIHIEELQERIVSAHLDISPDGMAFHERIGKPRTVAEAIAEAVKTLSIEVDDDVDRRLGFAVTAMAEAHHGDCIREACSCSKCWAEDLLGVGTLDGVHRNASYFKSAFGEGRGLDEAIRYLAEYDPKPSGGWLTSDRSDFAAHVPRWKAEAKLAHKWLVEYAARHPIERTK